MPQNEYMERWRKLHGKRLDHDERARKKAAREGHKQSYDAQNLRGLKAKLRANERRKEKIQMRKKIKAHEERDVKTNNEKEPSEPVPSYLLDRNNPSSAKQASLEPNDLQWSPLLETRQAIGREKSLRKSRISELRSLRGSLFLCPKRGISESEAFSVVTTGKKIKQKAWKRKINKMTFVGPGFTRRDPKHERFIRPMGLRQKKAHTSVTSLGVTTSLPILSVKKNPSSALFTNLGVLTKGTVIEVDTSELGMTNASGKVVWGRYAQITNDCENDGCVNAVLLE